MTHGIKTARTLFGLCQGTGEPRLQCKAKMQRTCKEMQKVVMCSIGADEVIVANIPKESGSNDPASEGLHMMCS